MAKELATKDQILNKIKNQGEYKNGQRDKVTLKSVLDKFNGVPLFEGDNVPALTTNFPEGAAG